jgi:hypothetical protein
MPLSFRRAAAAHRPASRAPRPDPHLERVFIHVEPLDEQLHDPRLLGGEQLVSSHGEVCEQNRDLALGMSSSACRELMVGTAPRREG